MKRNIPAYWQVESLINDVVTAKNTRTNEIFSGSVSDYLAIMYETSNINPIVYVSDTPPDTTKEGSIWLNKNSGLWAIKEANEWVSPNLEKIDEAVYLVSPKAGYLKSGTVADPMDYPKATPRLQFALESAEQLTGIVHISGSLAVKNGAAYLYKNDAWELIPVTARNWVLCMEKENIKLLISSTHYARSVDDITWIETALPVEKPWSACVAGQKFMIASQDRVCHSVDGLAWSVENVGLGGAPTKAVASSTGYAVIANNRVVTSPNAIAWTIGAIVPTVYVENDTIKSTNSYTGVFNLNETLFKVSIDTEYTINDHLHVIDKTFDQMCLDGDTVFTLKAGVVGKYTFKQFVGEAIPHSLNGLDLYVKVA